MTKATAPGRGPAAAEGPGRPQPPDDDLSRDDAAEDKKTWGKTRAWAADLA